MTFEEWNDALLAHFFNAEKEGKRVHFFVSEETIREISGGESVAAFIQAVKAGPTRQLKNARGVFSTATALKEVWVRMSNRPPFFLPHLALCVLAASYDNSDGSEGYYKRLHGLLEEEISNRSPSKFCDMWELWEELQIWSSETKQGSLGEFRFSIQENRKHVQIPISQSILTTRERQALPQIFSSADLDSFDPPSDPSLTEALLKYGQDVLLHRTRALLKSESQDEIKAVLLETVREELEEWDGVGLGANVGEQTERHHLLLNLEIDRVVGRVSAFLRFHSIDDSRNALVQLKDRQTGVEYDADFDGGFSSRLIKKGESKPFSDFDWGKEISLTDGNDNQFRLRSSSFRIFESGLRYCVDDEIQRSKIQAGRPFTIAVSNQASDIIAWGEKNCEGWTEIQADGIPTGWRLFSCAQPQRSASIAKKYPALGLPTFARMNLRGGLRAGRGAEYLDISLPRIWVETTEEEHVISINGNPIQTVKGECELAILDPSMFLDGRAKVQLSTAAEPEVVLRNLNVSLRKSDEIDVQLLTFNPHVVEDGISVSGAIVSGVAPTPYPAHANYPSESCLLVGRGPDEMANNSEQPPWQPIWVIEKGRGKRRVRFCGSSLRDSEPLPLKKLHSKNGRKWNEAIYRERRLLTPPNNPKLAGLWRRYVEEASHA